MNPPLVAIYQQLGSPFVILTNMGLFAVPEELVQIPSASRLEFLDLSNNQLRSIPPDIEALTSLTALDLSNNRIDSLPWQMVAHSFQLIWFFTKKFGRC